MPETSQSINSGVIVALNPAMQDAAVRKLRDEQEKNPRLTIGDLFKDMITKTLQGRALELGVETERLAHTMLEGRQREKPFMTLNDLYAELIGEAVASYVARQQAIEGFHSQQIFGCSH